MPRPLFLAGALLALLSSAPAASAQSGPFWSVRCLDDASEGTCEPGGLSEFVLEQLNQTTLWLRSLGYSEPFVMTDGYLPVAFVGSDDLRVGDHSVFGFYSKGHTESGFGGSGRLVVNATHAIQFEREGDASGTVTHEVFHAVQANYPFFDRERSQQGWIVEGTAQAVEAAFLEHAYNVPVLGEGGHAHVYGYRAYDAQLAVPAGTDKLQLYATSHFWLALGDVLGSPSRVEYLDRVLDNVSSRTGIEGIDLRLQEDHGRSLADLYIAVVARHARDLRHYPTHGKTTPPLAPDQPVRAQRSIAPIAAHLYRVPIQPHGRGSEIEIRLTDAPGLRLVVDGHRFDAPDANGERNVYRDVVFGTDTLDVQIVNVLDQASSTDAQSYTLLATNTPIETCEPDRLMATLNPTWQRQNQQIQALLPAGMEIPGDIAMFVRSAERYTREAEPPGTSPGVSVVRFSGVVNDGGVSCVDPVGTNAGLAGEGESEALSDEEVEAAMQAQIERMSGMTPQELEALAGETVGAAMAGMADNGAGALMASIEGAAAEASPMTVVKLFAPTVTGWQLDMVVDRAALHGGAGRWAPNAQAVVAIGIEGVKPEDLRPGVYPARLLLTDMGAMYHRWQGDEREVDSGDGMTEVAFAGTRIEAESPGMRGEVTVRFLTGGTVKAHFALSGTGTVRTVESRFTYDDSGRIDGDETIRDEEERGPLAIRGSFVAPAAVEKTRLGRIVQRTARVPGR